MDEPKKARQTTSARLKPGDDRLDSWKEIATYLKRGIRAVQRWEKEENLPIHRHGHKKTDSVYAFAGELEAWLKTRGGRGTSQAGSGSPRHRLRYMENVEAYTLCLKGFQRCDRRTPQELARAIEYFQAAIGLDSSFALALAGVSHCYNMLGYYGYLQAAEAFSLARHNASQSLTLDPELAEGHAALGFCLLFHDWRWFDAADRLRRALEIDPRYAMATHWYGLSLLPAGKPFEAVSQVRRAWEQDPSSSVSNSYVASAYYLARQYDLAITKCLEIQSVDTNFVPSRVVLGRSLTQKGMAAQAVSELEAVLACCPESRDAQAALACARAAAGDRRGARMILRDLELPGAASPSGHLALAFIGLQEWGKALEALNEAIGQRFPGLVFLKADPVYDPLKHHDEFSVLAERIGLK